ncbi:hypothetical protein GpartN1_g5796.t1 [Galdieria partita]|uniref:RRM domain-containing protein n=1 Tax=Galdieria partita TaxID=83374 RepID=A0A9C7UT15_9RHOD|nr:hypothetical protein GpartN1_g5796.t1 [Galdieria partita]
MGKQPCLSFTSVPLTIHRSTSEYKKTPCCSNICRKDFYCGRNYNNGFLCRPPVWEKNFIFPHSCSGRWYLSAVHDVSESSPQGTDENKVSLEERQKRRVYVANIPYTVRWQEIKDHMREAGPVQYVHLFLDRLKRSKGSALVEYMTEEAAQKAIELLNNSVIAGRSLVVREDRGSIFPDGERKVYRLVFRHLVPGMRWQELRERCKPYGSVVRAIIRRSATNDEANGIVFFPEFEQARKAQEELNGTVWDGREIECELEYDTNDERRRDSKQDNGTTF